MNVFITGATGVLGRPVVRQLVESGHQVRGLARSEANVALLRELGAEPVRVDLYDPASLAKAMRDCRGALHLATKVPPTAQVGRRSAWRETDRIRREGTRALVEGALSADVECVLYPSVCFVYPESGTQWVDASACPQPVIADYCRSTFDAEAQVQRFTAAGGRGITLRMGYFYGPTSGQSRDQMRLAHWGIASVPGRPEAHHPYVAISDAARAVVAALESAPAGTFDIVEDEPPTTAQLNRAMALAAGRQRLRSLPGWLLRAMMDAELLDAMSRSQRVSNRRFKEATGWAPEISTNAGGWNLVEKALHP